MTIDWPQFTPWSALSGGALIGLSAALLYLLLGRIAGISGILGGLLTQNCTDRAWRVLFLLGLVGSPAIWKFLFAEIPSLPQHTETLPLEWALICVGGLLVGFGTRLGNGCTSGHGVCGLSALSKRSLVAVLCFMASGMLTVFVTRHLPGS